MNIYVCNNNEKGYESEGEQGEFGGVKGKGGNEITYDLKNRIII